MCKCLSVHHMCCIFNSLQPIGILAVVPIESGHKQFGTLQSASNYSLLNHIITEHTIIAISEIIIVTAKRTYLQL